MCYTQEIINDLASYFERAGYEDVLTANNAEVSAVKCYAHLLKLYYVFAYHNINIYSFAEYGPEDDYVSKVFYGSDDLLAYLNHRGIINTVFFGADGY